MSLLCDPTWALSTPPNTQLTLAGRPLLCFRRRLSSSQSSYLDQHWSRKKLLCNPICPLDKTASSQRRSCCSSYSMYVTCAGTWRSTSYVKKITSKRVRLLLINHDPCMMLVEYVQCVCPIPPSVGVSSEPCHSI